MQSKFEGLIAGGALMVAACFSSGAQAGTIVFNLGTTEAFYGDTYSVDGYTFTNSSGATDAYFTWGSNSSFNANVTGDLAQDYASTTNTITNNADNPFSFTSIGLADVYNDGTGGAIQFTFNHEGGGSSTQDVTLTSGVFGLQNFIFTGENNLSSVVFQAISTGGDFLQLDNVGVSASAVTTTPLPSTWTMLITGFVGLGFFAYRGMKKGSAAATAAG